jgi:hypothetical protein
VKTVRCARALVARGQLGSVEAELAKRAPRQWALLEELWRTGDLVPLSDLFRRCGESRSALRALENKGWVRLETVPVHRTPGPGA